MALVRHVTKNHNFIVTAPVLLAAKGVTVCRASRQPGSLVVTVGGSWPVPPTVVGSNANFTQVRSGVVQ